MSRDKDNKIVTASEDDVQRYADGGAPEVASAGMFNRGAASSQSDEPPDGETGELQRLREELLECKDKYVRLQADFANSLKRLRVQHEEELLLAGMDLARALLPALDNFQRTLRNLPPAAEHDPIAEGVRLISEQLEKALREHGVTTIEAEGKPFDPTVHQALLQDRETDYPPGTVSQELERGYRMRDRVLRPAKVAVSAKADD